jgi:ubiquinone/menaquinone biosynthesis C-methylase UbiE
LGEFVVVVNAIEGYRLWSASYDRDANPIVALERRVVGERLPPLYGRTLLDVATGTGYWLNYARSQGAQAFGIDLSIEMLAQNAAKPLARNRLICADMSCLPIKDGVADVAICSLAVGYVESVVKLFRELARTAKTIIVTDLHERAVQAGWQRGFSVHGARYQIRQFGHSTRELDHEAHTAGLQIQWRTESRVGEPERPLFADAGREHAFNQVSRIPAILSTCWARAC